MYSVDSGPGSSSDANLDLGLDSSSEANARPAPRVGPRERLAMNGAASLSDLELVAILLGTGSGALPVSVLAARVLEDAGGLGRLVRQSIADLASQPGIGTAKAARLLAAAEIGHRVSSRPLMRHKPIRNSRDVDAALRPRMLGATREHFFAVALDAKNHPLAEIEVAIGGLAACCVAPSDVFRPLLREAALGVIFAHNHPSGDPSPSPEDIQLTARLVSAGELLGVQVLDHIILGDTRYYSFLDSGLLAARHPVPEPPPIA